jgi:hypothetical protein
MQFQRASLNGGISLKYVSILQAAVIAQNNLHSLNDSKRLLERGANVSDDNRLAPLIVTAKDMEIVDLLLHYGADPFEFIRAKRSPAYSFTPYTS